MAIISILSSVLCGLVASPRLGHAAITDQSQLSNGHLPSTSIEPLSWEEATSKALDLIAKLNLTEKVAIVTGQSDGGNCIGNIAPIERVGFGGICFQDGPTSLRLTDKASVFPAGLTAGASWDVDLIRRRAVALGEEFRWKGAHVFLGPVGGALGRHPLGGRNWEGFSVDPYLSGVAVAASVQGVQSVGVQAVSKHYIGNEQQTQASNSVSPSGETVEGISSNMDDRTFHELYLWPFTEAVRAGTASIMCAYNRVNQTYSCQNEYILSHVLKEQLGFDGYVVSDWYATHSGVASANNGLDLEMPGNVASRSQQQAYFGNSLFQAVQNGSVSVDRIDDMARRVLTPYFQLRQDEDFPSADPSFADVTRVTYGVGDPAPGPSLARDVRTKEHQQLIRELAAAGTVLLKNVDNVLPLKNLSDLAVFGNDAPAPAPGSYWDGETAYEYGTIFVGGGSGTGRSSIVVSPLDAIKARAEAEGTRIVSIFDNNLLAAGIFNGLYPQPEHCLVFLKKWSSETHDRTSFELEFNSTLVVEQVASRCPNTIVITHAAGITAMPWADNPNVTAILAAHLPGDQSGNAIVDILWGVVNPSGRLPYTIPRNGSDYGNPIVNITGDAQYDSDAWQSDFTEGLMIDYRHFDARNITPLYEFGFGLSYTTFDLDSKLTIKKLPANSSSHVDESSYAPKDQDFDDLYEITAKVSNSGDLAGAVVSQLYLSYGSNSAVPSGTPKSVLRGFDKVFLEPGETASVSFTLRRRDVSYWDTAVQRWRIPSGSATVGVGFSLKDIRASAEISLS